MTAPDGMIAAITGINGGRLATRNLPDLETTGLELVNPRDFRGSDVGGVRCAIPPYSAFGRVRIVCAVSSPLVSAASTVPMTGPA
jgi:hypothetical protein